MGPTTSVLITTFCFKGAKVFLGFTDKKNCCTENLVNNYGLLKNNINDKLIIMNTVCFSLRPGICALQICHPSPSWPPCWEGTKDIIRAFFFVKKIEKYLSWKNNIITTPQLIYSLLTSSCSSDQIIKQPSLFIPTSARDLSSVSEKHLLTITIIIMTSQQVDTIMPENRPHNYTVL